MENLKDLTGSQQIEVLKGLTQQAGAWLCNMTARSLRDHTGAPRAGDGSYNGQDLARWMAGRAEGAELDDDQLEKTLNAAELLYYALADSRGAGVAVSVADHLTELETAGGERMLAEFARELLRQFRTYAEIERADVLARRLAPAELRKEVERRVRDELEREAQAEAEGALDFACVCLDCKRLRQGRRWVQADPPAGRKVIRSYCDQAPGCGDSGKRKGR